MALNVTDVQLNINVGLSAVITCITIPGNFLLLLIFYKYKNLRDQNNTAITMLSLTDFLRGCIVMTSKIHNQLGRVEELNRAVCHITAIVCAFSFVFCPLILALISFVRYCKIVPRGDKCWQFNNRIFHSLSCVLLLTAVLFSILPFIGVGNYAYSASHGVCFADWREVNKVYRTIFYVLVIGIAFPVLTISYTMLYMALRKHNKAFVSKHCIDKSISHPKGASSFSTVATLSITIAEEDICGLDNDDSTVPQNQYKGIYEVDIDEDTTQLPKCKQGTYEVNKNLKCNTVPRPEYTGIFEIDNLENYNGTSGTQLNFTTHILTPIPEHFEDSSISSSEEEKDKDSSQMTENEKEEEVDIFAEKKSNIAVITKPREGHVSPPAQPLSNTNKDMKKVNKKMKQASGFIKNLSKQECQVTKSLIFIFIAYVVCWFPAALVNVISLYHAKHIPEIWYYIIVSMVELKSALDPVIYGLGNRRYQNALKCMARQARNKLRGIFRVIVCCYHK